MLLHQFCGYFKRNISPHPHPLFPVGREKQGSGLNELLKQTTCHPHLGLGNPWWLRQLCTLQNQADSESFLKTAPTHTVSGSSDVRAPVLVEPRCWRLQWQKGEGIQHQISLSDTACLHMVLNKKKGTYPLLKQLRRRGGNFNGCYLSHKLRFLGFSVLHNY